MRVAELKAIAKEHGLRGYSRLRKAKLTALLQSSPPALRTRPPRPTRPPPPLPQLVRFRPDRAQRAPTLRRPRQPSSQKIDIFEQQEMCKNRPHITSKLNDCYDWSVNHAPKTIKDGASRAFKTFKDKIVVLYNGVTGN